MGGESSADGIRGVIVDSGMGSSVHAEELGEAAGTEDEERRVRSLRNCTDVVVAVCDAVPCGLVGASHSTTLQLTISRPANRALLLPGQTRGAHSRVRPCHDWSFRKVLSSLSRERWARKGGNPDFMPMEPSPQKIWVNALQRDNTAISSASISPVGRGLPLGIWQKSGGDAHLSKSGNLDTIRA